MYQSLSLISIGHASSLFLALTYCLCIGFDLLFPEHAMYRAWQTLLPGFSWLTWKSFFIGLAWSYSYGWYFAVIWVPIYNYFDRKKNPRNI